ncbi:hypothetical protein BGW36DRAFT_304334, partial [Talaromyces proteolyticus]
FKTCCIGFGLLAFAPAIIACFRPSNCRFSMSMAYIRYVVYNVLGAVFYLGRLPERLFVKSRVSDAILHLILLGSALTFSVTLLNAYESPKNPVGIRCAWWD